MTYVLMAALGTERGVGSAQVAKLIVDEVEEVILVGHSRGGIVTAKWPSGYRT